MRKRIWLLLSILFINSAQAGPDSQSIDEAVRYAMEVFDVPGMAVSVVYKGETVYSEGHGVLEIGKDSPVDDDSLFQIASITKAFTAAALAILADEGKLAWDNPVIDYLPEFRMYDAWVTRELTVRDLLTHRSGLPLGAGDLLSLPPGETTRSEIIKALRFLKPSSSFRSKYDYDNVLYVVAGEIVSRVSGQPYEEFIEGRLFKPLGMSTCRASLGRASSAGNLATPHIRLKGALGVTHSLATEEASPAGGINCSASAMTKWMNFILSEGVASDGTRLVSEGQFKELLGPVTLTSTPDFLVEHAGSHLTAYSLGWFVSSFYGQPIYAHGGGLWGMTSYIMLFPRLGLGLFASSNSMSRAPRAVLYEISHQFLNDSAPKGDMDWIAFVHDYFEQKEQEGDQSVAEVFAERNKNSKPSLPLDAYAGTYRDAWYGDIYISMNKNGELWLKSGRSDGLQGPLEHFQYNTFVARWENRQLMADAFITFYLSPAGRVDRASMEAVSPNTDFSFDFHDLDLRFVE